MEERIGVGDWHYIDEEIQLATMEAPLPGDDCSYFDALKVRFQVSSAWADGTWDNVEVCLGLFPCITIAKQPYAGHDETIAIDLNSTFGESLLSARSFLTVSLLTVTGDNRDNNDVDGWGLRGDCNSHGTVLWLRETGQS
ncbi:hypothetical protein IF1G_11018 [Cordyceps javanica]|uniref:Uncharacterized protein n=1 Tax=Cordyceps javanica TaxID=43265 RepID=A0A545ULP1_9HYPO|nr:hypothetical protein IF1G_11018 [Cordyceps javanica]